MITAGKTNDKELKVLMDRYLQRLPHYTSFNLEEIPDLRNTRNLKPAQVKLKEAGNILERIKPGDTVILLDEKGEALTSAGLAKRLQNYLNTATKHLVFVVGGAYGFDDKLYQRAEGKLSLSRMTFSHQMVRLFFLEQLYRAFTILRGEPYHNR